MIIFKKTINSSKKLNIKKLMSLPAPLTRGKGRVNFEGHTETWYSQKKLPGRGLNIPGRHVAGDGTVRDGDGFICVSSDDYSKGTVVNTSLGTGKVYDTGSGIGNIDIYTNW